MRPPSRRSTGRRDDRVMTDPKTPARTRSPSDDGSGADAPTASLAARIARNDPERREALRDRASRGPADPPTTPIPDRQDTGAGRGLTEGSETAPRSGRVDAAGATYGPDRERRRIGTTAAGEAPTESVGGAMDDGTDEPDPRREG